jgi:hypothetical protein
VIALFLALAVAAGLFAALRTVQLGASSTASSVSAAQIAQRNRQLDAAEAKLRAEANRQPPALPAVPAAAPQTQAEPQRVIYVRPNPVVQVSSHERESEHEDAYEHESEHEGGELDD